MARTIKVALIGSNGTGKTSLRGQFTSGQFSSSYRATIGADFIAKTIRLSEGDSLSVSDQNTSNTPSTSTSANGIDHQPAGEAVTLQIWDTAGQERFSALSSAFFRGADAAIIVYDVRRPKSLAEVSTWWRAFADKCPVASEEEATWPVIVVGNKIDLLNRVEGVEDAVWRKEEAKEFVESLIDIGEENLPGGSEARHSHSGSSSSPRVSMDGPKAVSITINGNDIDGLLSENDTENRLYPAAATTYNSSRTGNTIFHTPSSSLHSSEHFHSAASSFYSQSPISPTHSPSPTYAQVVSGSRSRSRSRRRMTIDTVSSSSETITPSLYARGPNNRAANGPASPGPPTPRTPSIRHPWPPPDLLPPERGAKLLFTSAKTGEGVAEVFNYIARRTVRRLEWVEAHSFELPFGSEGPGRSALLDDRNVNNLAQFGSLSSRCC